MKVSNIVIISLLSLGLATEFLPGTAFSKDIQWQSFSGGMARGKSENKKVFLHFYAEWCVSCKVMEDKTFRDAGVIAALNSNFIPIKVDVDRESQTSAMFRVKLLPDTWFIAEDNEVIGHRPGYISPQQLKVILKMLMDEDAEQ